MGIPTNRNGTTTKDQRFVNCYPEEIENPSNESKRYYCNKRPGHTLVSTIGPNGSTARGIYFWNDVQYTVFDNKLYKNATHLLTFRTNYGTIGFETINADQQMLFVCDGLDGYIIYANDQIRKVNPDTWTASTSYNVNKVVRPTIQNGFCYLVTIAGTSGGFEPTWNTTLDGITYDGGVTYKTIAYVNFPSQEATISRTNSTAYGLGVIATDGSYPDLAFTVTTAGTTASSPPTWASTIGSTTTDGTVIWTTIARSSVLTGHIPKPIYIDGYLTLLDSNGILVNSDVSDPFTWPSLDYISADLLPDKALWIERQTNHIAVFGANSIEFFYVNSTGEGSPFKRTSQAAALLGSICVNSIQQKDGIIFFVANSDTGGFHVASIEGLKVKGMTNETFNRIIQAEGDSIKNCYAYTTRVNGHYFYILNLVAQNRSIVYDITQQFWHEWSWNNGKMPFVYSSRKNQEYFLVGLSTGGVYKMDNSAVTDIGTSILLLVQTPPLDGGKMIRKFNRRATLVCDFSDNSNVSLSYSDDDYTSWSSDKVRAVKKDRTTWTALGSFRRRAFRIQHSSNTAFRAEALELEVEEGMY